MNWKIVVEKKQPEILTYSRGRDGSRNIFD